MVLECSLLAVPCVVLTTCAVGAVIHSLKDDWSWSLCLLLGSVLSATDPVTIAPIMKDVRAPHGLILLVLGESLISEGGVSVLYYIFVGHLEGDNYTASRICLLLVYDFILSPLFGMATGLITVALMRRANVLLKHEDTTIQIAIAVSCAYLTFFFAYYSFHLNGVLAALSAGIVVSTFGKKVILRPAQFHHVWEIIEWALATLIFLLAGNVNNYYPGLIIISCNHNSGLIIHDTSTKHLTWLDIGIIAALFATLTAIRIGVVGSFFAAQAYHVVSPSHHLKATEACFLSVTGVRGTLSMIFALSILKYSHKGYLTVEEGQLALRYAGGVIVLSLLLGGGPAELYLKTFRLTQKESTELTFIEPFLNARIREAVYADFEKNKSDYGSNVELDELVQYSTLLSSKSSDDSSMQASVDRLVGDRPLNSELYVHIRNVLMGAVRANYMGYIEKRMLPRYSYAASVLLTSVDVVMSDHNGHDTDSVGDWQLVAEALTVSPTLKWLYGHGIDPFTWLCFVVNKVHLFSSSWRRCMLSARSMSSVLM
jgi:NhaP-type Na+/H+ or K+/H+ antiporter